MRKLIGKSAFFMFLRILNHNGYDAMNLSFMVTFVLS
jgi:hypothetical protein